MRHTVSSDHGLRTNGKKTPSKLAKKEEAVDAGKSAKSFQGKVVKMPGGRIKGTLSVHQAKGHDDHDKKSGESSVEHVKEDVKVETQQESRKQKSPDGDLLLQWGQRKRLRGRQDPKNGSEDAAGPLKKAIRVDRRVVRADKQAVPSQAQPPVQTKTNVLRPPTPSPQENTPTPSRRLVEGANGHLSAAACDSNHCQSSSALHTAEDADQNGGHCPENTPKVDADLTTTSGGSPAGNATLATTHMEIDEDRSLTAEKVNLDHFEWPKFLIPLTRKEKEDDFFIIKGSKLSQRPKKRPKNVERALQFISPGSWLCEMTRERYEVREKKSSKKQKPRGLKAMGSMDSDSD